MKIKITGSHILALAITGGIAIWMAGGTVNIGGQTPEAEKPAIAERSKADQKNPFRVNVIEMQPIDREQSHSVRGRTKADAIISIRAETGGILQQRLVNRGDRVNEGDLVCIIDKGAREASLESARAALARAQAEYESNKRLADMGFASDLKVRQMLANLNATKAQVHQTQVELDRIRIEANAAGVVQDPVASVGDVLQPGGTCITLVDSDPMYFTGQVAERSIGMIRVGQSAEIRLVTGETIKGAVSYLAPAADPQTRTFSVEVRLEPGNVNIRDGLTATANILLPPTKSFRISPSWISLADSGQVGVKTVNEQNIVGFKPVNILTQTNNGFWVSGLADGDRIITLGQEYVIAGETVEPVIGPIQKVKVNQ